MRTDDDTTTRPTPLFASLSLSSPELFTIKTSSTTSIIRARDLAITLSATAAPETALVAVIRVQVPVQIYRFLPRDLPFGIHVGQDDLVNVIESISNHFFRFGIGHYAIVYLFIASIAFALGDNYQSLYRDNFWFCLLWLLQIFFDNFLWLCDDFRSLCLLRVPPWLYLLFGNFRFLFGDYIGLLFSDYFGLLFRYIFGLPFLQVLKSIATTFIFDSRHAILILCFFLPAKTDIV